VRRLFVFDVVAMVLFCESCVRLDNNKTAVFIRLSNVGGTLFALTLILSIGGWGNAHIFFKRGVKRGARIKANIVGDIEYGLT